MDWIIIVLVAYFILAIVGVVDKFLLSQIITDNRLYTFLIGVLGLFVFTAIPFVTFAWPGLWGFFLDVVSGGFLIAALFLFYRALQEGEASLVIPLIGGGLPLAVFVFSLLFLGSSFSTRQLLAVFFLLVGGVLITLIPKAKARWWQFWKRRKPSGVGIAMIATLCFATYFVMSEHIYATQGFATGFILSRLGSFFAVCWLLFDSSFIRTLKRFFHDFIKKKKYIFFINQLFGAVGFLGQSYAISIKSAAIVNALQGVQYVFLLIIASGVSLLLPHVIQERVTRIVIAEKSIAIIVIAIGVYLITV